MTGSLLFLPDISGYTQFIQTTEVAHSQHVIAELLEVMIDANTQNLKLAEIEGDALFFYKEGDIPSQEKLLAQIETMFTVFYSHLKLLEKNRICPCNACATAPDLQLKIIAHAGELQFIEVQGTRKPFGPQVIEAHRLMKNSVDSDNYALISKELASEIGLPVYYYSKLFRFKEGKDSYDGTEVEYIYTLIDPGNLSLRPFDTPKKVHFEKPPAVELHKTMAADANTVFEIITNYSYRHYWVKGVDAFEYDPDEVTRVGTEHVCVINGKHLDFVTVIKDVKPGQMVYGERTHSPPPLDTLYQFFVLTPIDHMSCRLDAQMYWEAKSPIKKVIMALFGQRAFKKNMVKALDDLQSYLQKYGQPT